MTIVFTFYDVNGNALGTVDQTFGAGQVDQMQSFEVQFDSTERLGGYSYEVTS